MIKNMKNIKKFLIFLGCFIFFIIILGIAEFNWSLNASVLGQKEEIINEEGFGNSIFVDKKGKVFISFIRRNGELVLLNRVSSNDWQEEVVANDGFFGAKTNIKIDNQGNFYILYINQKRELKIAKKQINSSWSFEKIADNAFLYSSLFIDEKGNLYISFWIPEKGMFFARKENQKWQIEIVDGGEVGWWNSLFVDKYGTPHISYFDFKNKNLLYIYFNGKYWKKEIVDFEGDVGRWNSIFVKKDGEVLISYFDNTNGDLKLAQKKSNGWILERVDEKGIVGERTNVFFNETENTPLISYVSGFDNSFRLAKKIDGFWRVFLVERSLNLLTKKIKGEIGGDNSIFIDSQGGIHLLWQDLFNKNLKYLNLNF